VGCDRSGNWFPEGRANDGIQVGAPDDWRWARDGLQHAAVRRLVGNPKSVKTIKPHHPGDGDLTIWVYDSDIAGATQCQVLIGSSFALIDCGVGSCVVDLLWESGSKLTAHEKAVPAMIGGYNTNPIMEGTANGQRKEAGSPATAGEIVDRLKARVSHAGSFQASAKCLKTKEMPALGLASFALHHRPNDLLLWRQPP
jgi:hypothetical protein